MADPWRCPECKTWLAPHITEHRCDPGGGTLAVVGAPPSTQPPASVTISGPPYWYWATVTSTGHTAQVGPVVDVTGWGPDAA